MERRSSPVADRRALTTALRSLRETCGLSLEEAASQALDASAAKLSRMETGRQTPGPRDVRDLCRLYGVDADRTAHLVALARSAREEGWWESYEFEMDDYIGLETAATVIQDFQNAGIPALLQTRQYAETYMTHVINPARNIPHEPAQIRRWLDLREKRLQVVSPGSGVELHFVLDEAALLRATRGIDMTSQVDHLRHVSTYPNVRLHVVPLGQGEYAGQQGGFTILTLPDEVPDVVYLETLAGYFQLEGTAEVRRFRRLFERISAARADESETAAILERLREGT